MTIVDKRDAATGRGYHFFVFQNRLGVQLAAPNPTNYVSSPLSLTDGLWHHVAVTVNRRFGFSNVASIGFYYDGALVVTLSPSTQPGSLANNSPLRVGTRTGANPLTDWFQGDIDELELFNRVLTLEEVFQIFMADSFGKCKS